MLQKVCFRSVSMMRKILILNTYMKNLLEKDIEK